MGVMKKLLFLSEEMYDTVGIAVAHWARVVEVSPGKIKFYLTHENSSFGSYDLEDLLEATVDWCHWVINNPGCQNEYWHKFANAVLTDPDSADFDLTIVDAIIQHSAFGEIRYA